jgi:predicted kinase
MIELIVLVGLPGSGKSTYFHAHFAATHAHVSKDLMPKARRRDDHQQRDIEAALAVGKSVVVDNTNPTPDVRASLINLGRRHGARIVAIYFETDVRTAIMRNRRREGKARVPDVAIFATKKKLVPPALEEGFDEVRVIAQVEAQ